MKTYPLKSISLEDAITKQFSFVDSITRYFSGSEMLTRGDLGVVRGLNHPVYTRKVEKVIANFFDAEDAILVRGSGTAAIRLAMHSYLKSNDTLLIHDAPIYPTTNNSISLMNLNIKQVNFNKLDEIKVPNDVDAILIQYTRQKPDDSYSMKDVVNYFKSNYPKLPIITDDNYAVMKVNKIGVELGSDLSCFSCFKLLGPAGIGCIVGKKEAIEKIRSENYSGGLQVQGYEAMDVMNGLTYAPVALANQAIVVEKTKNELNSGKIEGVKRAYIANAQSKVLLVEFNKPIAIEVLDEAEKLGAAPNPVGAESKYEIVPMFYRVSGTFKEYDPQLLKTTIRINPYRSGSSTIIRILKKAIAKVN